MLALLTEPDEEATNVTIFASVRLPRLEVASQKRKASYGVLSGKHSQHETDAKLPHAWPFGRERSKGGSKEQFEHYIVGKST